MYFTTLTAIIIIIFLIHSIIPTLYNKYINSNIIKLTNKDNEIMLT